MIEEEKLNKSVDKILLHKPMKQKDLKKGETTEPKTKKRSVQKKSK